MMTRTFFFFFLGGTLSNDAQGAIKESQQMNS